MEIQYFGGNCVRINTKKASVVVDDTLAELGLKSITKSGDIVLFTLPCDFDNKNKNFVIDKPGEYEVSGVSIQAMSARAHMDEEDKHTASLFKIIAGDVHVVVTGHIYPKLDDNQLEAIGKIDILIIPVGGVGYTLDGSGALNIIKQINPTIIIPTHYADKSVKYPVPQRDLSDILKDLSMEVSETTQKLKIKSNEIGEVSKLIVLERQ